MLIAIFYLALLALGCMYWILRYEAAKVDHIKFLAGSMIAVNFLGVLIVFSEYVITQKISLVLVALFLITNIAAAIVGRENA